MKSAIIGAGVSGLAAGKLLHGKHDVTIFESTDSIGGIAKTKNVEGNSYHVTGGHCFNSKFQDVLNFVFSIYPESKWNKIERKARIFFKDKFVSYPIEFALKEINEFDPDLVYKIIEDLFVEKDEKEPNNLEEWFISKFGNTLASQYFIPYNKKIWGKEPADMSYGWVEDKLPIPNKKEIINGLFVNAKDKMPHSFFYYPKTNNQFDFIKALSSDLNIRFNCIVTNIQAIDGSWLINNKEVFDAVISTVPLNILPSLIHAVPSEVLAASSRLRYNKVTTMLWESKPTENTWTYFPSDNTIFHRHIHIGNFFLPRTNHIITEVVGNISEADMVKEGLKFKHLIRPLAYHVSDHAYVVYDENYSHARKVIMNYLEGINLNTLGRFGEWEYYNMDVCIKSAIQLVTSKFD